jgi:2-keto-3-deoxy-L-rhamnonate aldolase RhmA
MQGSEAREIHISRGERYRPMKRSRVLDKLRKGEFVVAAGMNRIAEPWLAETIGRIGFDVIWFDMEHRAFGIDKLDALGLACRATGIDLMVRVLKTGYTSPMRTLESGASGIMVPHVRSVEEARQWVEWVRFPPLGRRGFDGAGADADYALADPSTYLREADKDVFLVLQIEDKEALDCVDEIAAVPGVDLLFVGPGDLSISLGVPFELDHPVLQEAITRVAAASGKAGKWWGIPTASREQAQEALDRGARLITAGNDHLFLIRGFQDAFAEFSSLAVRS